MADILIRGMEMPKGCDECRLFNECWCMALGIENWRKSYNKPPKGERLPDCPLAPLPEGHGRGIDADAVIATYTPDSYELNKMHMTQESYDKLPTVAAIKIAISNALTLIPPEGGTDDG